MKATWTYGTRPGVMVIDPSVFLHIQGRKEACERNKSEAFAYERRAAALLRYLQDVQEEHGHVYEQRVPMINVLIEREIIALWVAHQNAGEMP